MIYAGLLIILDKICTSKEIKKKENEISRTVPRAFCASVKHFTLKQFFQFLSYLLIVQFSDKIIQKSLPF